VSILLRWAVSALAVWAAVRLVPGLSLEGGLGHTFAVALVLGGVNAIVRPLLRFLACGLIFLTLGLFLLVINAAMLLLAAELSQLLGLRFVVDGFWAALLGSIVISLVSYTASLVVPGPSRRR
jgi:putative membrane protein